MIIGMALALGAAGFALALAGTRSWAYVLFYLAFLPFLTLDPSQGGLVAMDGLQGGNVAWKLGVRALTTAGMGWLAFRRRAAVFSLLARPSSLPVLGLFVWAVIGLPRAQDPWVSFFRLGELLAFFVMGIVLATEVGAARSAGEPEERRLAPGDVIRLHALALLPILISAIAFTLMHPEIAFHESSSGVRRMGHKFMNSNVLGFAGTVVFLWSVSALRTRVVLGLAGSETRRQRTKEIAVAWLSLGVAGYVLYHSRSRTASITAVGGLALLWMPWPTPRLVGESTASMTTTARLRSLRKIGMVAAGCMVLVAAATSLGTIEEWFMRGGTSADIASGTGRTGLWSDLLLIQVPKAPLVGAGYLNLSDAGGFQHAGHAWNNAHNTYLFALVSTGIPGLLCVLCIIGLPLYVSFRRALQPGSGTDHATWMERAREQEAWTLVFALQSIVAISSITGFGVAGYPNVAMLFHYGLFAWVLSPASTAPAAATATAPARSVESARHRLSTRPARQSASLAAALASSSLAAPPAAPHPRMHRAVPGPQIPRSVR